MLPCVSALFRTFIVRLFRGGAILIGGCVAISASACAAAGQCRSIDDFIAASLAAYNLQPSPPADPPTLLRRVSLDLVGLPPSPEVARTFLANPSGDAYVRVVDTLLASQAFGERWAVPWLDLARFADTQGYEKDNLRTIWAY